MGAKKDAQRDMGNPSTACKHPAPWNSQGPLKDGSGRSYTVYRCGECGQEMRKHYYD